MTAAFREFIFDCAPWIFAHLFDGKTHFAAILIQCNNLGFVLVVQLKELFSVDRCVCPCNFTYVNKTFNTWKYFKESTIIFDVHYFSFHYRAFRDVCRKDIPWMRSKLFETKADPFLLIIEVEHHHFKFLIELEHFARMADTSPANVGDVK